MKKIVFFLVALTIIASACNNAHDHDHANNEPQTKQDSLLKEVLDGHDVAMKMQMTKMEKTKQGVQRLIDSVSKLPAKANEALATYKEHLNEVLKDLSYADNAMNKWMNEFNYDSAKNNLEERIKYLTDEKLKVGHVKEAMLGSLQKADSLLKAKF
ncbi:MAG: viral A-type inclusion protein [Bacteroidota bacterium]